MSGRISFIGAGPGAADLITVRGARRITEADVVVWAASLVAPECIREHARADAELVDSSRLTHEQAVEIYRRAERDRLSVARVHSGDPALWGAVQEQYDVCTRMDLEVEIVPGVPAFSAAAASVGRELTVPEIAQSVVLTRLEGGKTPMPDGEKVREFARHGTTMALFLSAARVGQLVTELSAGGYPDDVPVLIAYKVTWPDELMLRTTLGELEQTVKQHKLWRHTLFIVGRALSEGGTRSRLYHAGHFHTYRRADPAARSAPRAESRSRARSSADQDATSDELPHPRGGRSESNVAWWAVRDWQETARNAPRSSSGSRSARTPDDTQPELFGEQSTEASIAGTAVPEASVTVAEEVAPEAGTAPPAADVSAADVESGGSMRAEDAGTTPSAADATSTKSVGSRTSANTRASAKSANASTAAKSGKSPTGKAAKTGKTTTAKTAARKSTKTPSTRGKTAKSDDQTE